MAEKPPWWRYCEPPRWFPARLHRMACTHCRGLASVSRAWRSAQRREEEASRG